MPLVTGAPRRILYLDPAPAVGGSVISLYHLVKGLDRGQYEPLVLLRRNNSYAERFRALGVRVITFGSAAPDAQDETSTAWGGIRQGRLAALLRRWRWGQTLVQLTGFYLRTLPVVRKEAAELAAIMRAEQPDLVHLNDVVCVNRAGIMAARQCHMPAICHIRAMAWRNHFDRWQSRYLRGLVCISQAAQRHQASLGGKTSPNWVVYNGLDLADFDNLSASAQAIRAEFGVTPNQPLIGCVARLVAWKGVHIFIEAMAQVIDVFPKARALIVGSPEANTTDYARSLREKIIALGLQNNVTMVDFRPDIAGMLAALDILVHASIAPEPFGRIVIEGMAAGAAVIGTRAGAVPEIIDQGVNGWMVTPGDATEMAQAILYTLEHPEQRDACRQAAHHTVRARFTVDHYVRGIERVYEKVLD